MLTQRTSLQGNAPNITLAGFGVLLFATSLSGAAMAASDWFDSETDSARFGDWSVLCDESLNCEAYSGELEGARDGLFTLARRSDDQGWTVSISLSGTRPDLTYGIQIGVVDEPEYLPAEEVRLRRGEVIPGTATSYTILPVGAAAERVVARLRADPASGVGFAYMHVEFSDCSGAEENTLSFPLAGVSEALARIDEKQSRSEGDSRIATTGIGTGISAVCSD